MINQEGHTNDYVPRIKRTHGRRPRVWLDPDDCDHFRALVDTGEGVYCPDCGDFL